MPAPRIGHVIGDRFELLGELGRGGTATVWLAHDRVRQEQIALKIVHAHLADSPTAANRLRREIVASSRIRHPNVWVAYDLHEMQNMLLLCMPLHPGTNLGEHVARRGPHTAEALEKIGVQLAAALTAAHRAGVVHRDVSPSNVLVDDDGNAVLSDFDLARLDGARTRTATMVMGTPGYTAPELMEGERAGPLQDIYSLGAVLYQAATGVPPFRADNPMATVMRQVEGAHQPLVEARADLPARLTKTIDAMLSVDPLARPTSAREVGDMLRGELSWQPPTQEFAGRPHLPPGKHTVFLKETPTEFARRHRQKSKRKRRQGPLERIVDGVATGAKSWLSFNFPSIDLRSNEQVVADAVAVAAGLPTGALDVPDALFESPVRLVSGVDEQVAEQLAITAGKAGFETEVRAITGGPEAPPPTPSSGHLFVLVCSFLLAAGVTTSLVGGVMGMLIAVAIMGAMHSVSWGEPVEPPLVFGHDLRVHLADGHQHRLGPPGVQPVAATETAPAPGPAEPAKPDTYTIVQGRIDALEADILRSETLPGPMRDDLLSSVRALRDEAVHFKGLAEQVDDLLASHTTAEALDADAAQLQRRIRRLETLQRGGHAVDDQELRSLQDTLARRMEDLAAADDLQARRIRSTSRLLEIGTVANEVRRELFDVEVTRPLHDILDAVRREVIVGRTALEEAGLTTASTKPSADADARRRARLASEQRARR